MGDARVSGATSKPTDAVRAARSLGAPLLVFGSVVGWLAARLPSFCPVRLLLRVPCPSCGLTRAVRAALVGDFALATRFHPLWAALSAVAIGLGAWETWGCCTCGAWGTVLARPAVSRALWGLVGMMVGVWIARFFGAFGGPAPV